MTYRDFCYWLQGYFEIADPEDLTADQIVIIRRHLDMVFIHERGTAPGAKTTKAVGGPRDPGPGVVAMC